MRKTNRARSASYFSLFAALLAVFGLAVAISTSVTFAQQSDEGQPTPADASSKTLDTLTAQDMSGYQFDNEIANYIIGLDDAPVASYRGGIQGIPATNPAANGLNDLRSTEATQAYSEYLVEMQALAIANAEAVLGRELKIVGSYQYVFNGFSAEMSGEEAAKVARLDGVTLVQRERMEQLLTDVGPEWIGADSVWGGPKSAFGFVAELSGDNEVPPVVTTAEGTASFTYDFVSGVLEYEVNATDLVNITGMHVHTGTVGNNGGVVVALDTAAINAGTTYSVSLSAGQMSDFTDSLMNEGLYLNIHTSANAGGEIRGQLDLAGSMGEGIVVAIFDSGINHDHPSFADIGGDGYDHTNPLGSGTYIAGSYCADNPSFCNDKLIGAWDMVQDANDATSPDDSDGHGTHTASTVAGNFIPEATMYGPTTAITKSISGVAPHANIIAYDVCVDGCPGVALLAAAEQVVIDHQQLIDAGHPTGVSVINYSISGGENPYNDAMELAFLAATDAGIFVSASAGNSGPAEFTVAHVSPWVGTVGASTHSRALVNSLVNITSDGSVTPPADIEAVGFTSGYGPATLVYAGDYPNANDPDNDPAQCLQPYPPGTFSGEIVVCDRGSIARTAKGQNVLAGGAGGFVLANVDAQGEGVSGDAHFLPGLHIGDSDGDVVRTFLADVAAAGETATATITGVVYDVDPANGDIMAGFSSRGPVVSLPNLIKPDITAPGVDVWAAYANNPGGQDEGEEYAFLSGTSMSSPHNAGAVALMTALHPTWSPHQIKSAMMTTADTVDNFQSDGVTPTDPFNLGSGRVDLAQAQMAGLVLDETTANFEAADPELGGDVRTLNIASLGDSQCLGACSWDRTVMSVAQMTTTWTVMVEGITATVTPPTFTLATGETATVNVEVTVDGLPVDEYAFANVMMVPDHTGVITQHMPIAVVPVSAQVPELVVIETDDTTGTYTVEDVATTGADPLNVADDGLAMGMATNMSLSQDPTRNNIYDNLNDGTVEYITMTVPAGALRLVAEISSSEAPDIDLFVGTGTTPSAATEVCSSTTGSWEEYCNISGADLTTGDWWVLVQNWAGSDDQPDAVTLITAVVEPGNLGNFTVTAPASVAPGELFNIDLGYNVPSAVPGDRFYGSMTLADGPTEFAQTDVNLRILPPEMLMLGGPAVGFELGIPGTFSVTDEAGTGLVWSVTGDECDGTPNWVNDSPTAVCVNSDANANVNYDTSLISNEVDMSAADSCSAVNLDFMTNFRNLTVGADRMDVDVSDDGGTTWNTELTIANDVGGFQALPGVDISVDLSSYINADSIHVRFRYHNPDNSSPWDWYAQVDDIALTCVQLPSIDVMPDVISGTQVVDSIMTTTMTIVNTGTAPLSYNLYESDLAVSRDAQSQVVLWDQAQNGTGGIVSTFYVDEGPDQGGFSADDFVLDAPTSVELISVAGFVGDGSGSLANAEQINWFIFAHNSGLGAPDGNPVDGGALWSYSAAPTDPGVDITDGDITLDILAAGGSGVTLGAGTYWLSVAPSMDVTTHQRWNWHQGAPTAGTNSGHLIDFGIFGLPPGWQSIPGLGLPAYEGLAMRLEGQVNPVVEACDIPADLTWLSASPTSGIVAPGEQAMVNVTMDTTGLMIGTTYTGTLCVDSNAPANPLVRVPVSMEVTGESQIRVAHLAPFAMDPGTAVTVTLNGDNLLTDFHFGDSTQYVTVPSGDHDLAIYVGASMTPAVTATVNLAAGEDYSAMAVGGAHGWPVELQLHMDDNTAPAAGMAHVRFGHFAPFTEVMTDTLADIRLANGTVVVNDVPYDTLDTYMPLSAGEYDLQVTSADGSVVYMDLLPITLGEGDILYAVAVGDGTSQDLGVFAWATDAMGMMLPMKAYGVEFMAPTDALTGMVGTTVTYTVHVTNTGNFTDTFDMSLAGNDWTTTAPMSVTLGAGESAMAYVTVEIPADATDGEMDMVTITATSQGDDSVMADVMLTTTAEIPEPTEYTSYLPIVVRP